jgi:hypothetical protein
MTLFRLEFFSEQPAFSLPSSLSFLLPTLFAEHNIAASLVFCLYDANNLLTNTVIEFDYAVFHSFSNLMVQ